MNNDIKTSMDDDVKLVERKAALRANIRLLTYLTGIATQEKSELWRALFAEQIYSLKLLLNEQEGSGSDEAKTIENICYSNHDKS